MTADVPMADIPTDSDPVMIAPEQLSVLMLPTPTFAIPPSCFGPASLSSS